jgi:hypothetical protein
VSNVQHSLSDALNVKTLLPTRYSQYLTGSFRHIISLIKTLSVLNLLYITNHQTPLILTQLSGRILPLYFLWTLNNKINSSQVK